MPNEEAAKLGQMGKADATHSRRWKHLVTNQFKVYKGSCSVNLNVRITISQRMAEEPLLPQRGKTKRVQTDLGNHQRMARRLIFAARSSKEKTERYRWRPSHGGTKTIGSPDAHNHL